MCVDAGPQRQTLAVLMICPRHRKEKASGTNVSRGFCSRADWIRTSDLYTPSVARYQTTLQPESSFYVDFHFLTTRPEIQKRQTPRSPDSLVSIPAKSHSLTKKRQRPALDRPPELAPPTSDSGLYKKDSLSIENRRESFASPLNTKH